MASYFNYKYITGQVVHTLYYMDSLITSAALLFPFPEPLTCCVAPVSFSNYTR